MLRSSSKYSRFHRFQNFYKTLLRNLILLVNISGLVLKSSSGSCSYQVWSGRLMSRHPTNRCDGVKGSSKSFGDTYDNGLELTIASTSMITVSSSLYFNLARPITFLKQCLVDCTKRSKMPPYHGALSMLNTHSTLSPANCLATSLLLVIALRILAADLKFFPLSETILLGRPCRAAKRLREYRKDCYDKSDTRSRWTALVIQHMYRHIQTLLLAFG